MALTKLNFSGQPTVPSAKMPTGSVLQVVSDTPTSSMTTSSSNYNFIISKAITPSSTSSKILIMAVVHGAAQASNIELKLAIHRGGTALTGEFKNYASQGGFIAQAIPCIEVDSPQTTSEVVIVSEVRLEQVQEQYHQMLFVQLHLWRLQGNGD